LLQILGWLNRRNFNSDPWSDVGHQVSISCAWFTYGMLDGWSLLHRCGLCPARGAASAGAAPDALLPQLEGSAPHGSRSCCRCV